MTDLMVPLVLLVVGAGALALQFFLSTRENRWLGRILPTLSFLFALIYPLNLGASPGQSDFGLVVTLLATTLIANFPTLLLVAIYLACREKMHQQKQLEKMRVQDLE